MFCHGTENVEAQEKKMGKNVLQVKEEKAYLSAMKVQKV